MVNPNSNSHSIEEEHLTRENKESLYSHANRLPTTMGKLVSVQADGKPTIIYFFAPWCKICHLSIENLQTFYIDNPDIDVIAVALDYVSHEQVIDFTLEHQLTFPVVYGDSATKHKFNVSAYPSYYFLDANNNVKNRSIGYSSSLGLYFNRLLM